MRNYFFTFFSFCLPNMKNVCKKPYLPVSYFICQNFFNFFLSSTGLISHQERPPTGQCFLCRFGVAKKLQGGAPADFLGLDLIRNRRKFAPAVHVKRPPYKRSVGLFLFHVRWSLSISVCTNMLRQLPHTTRPV